MIEKLRRQLDRAKGLHFGDDVTKDDIIRKIQMYIGQTFNNNKATLYGIQLTNIEFDPKYVISGTSHRERELAWNIGVKKLINFIDTLIEECEIIQSNSNVMEKNKDKIESASITLSDDALNDLPQIRALRSELANLKSDQKNKTVWNLVPWSWIIPSLLVLLGGSFWLGYYIGNNRFDMEKNKLYEENTAFKTEIQELKSKNKELQDENSLRDANIVILKDSMQFLNNKISNLDLSQK